MKNVSLIFANEARTRAFGFSGALPWPHIKQDMKFFKEQTKGSIMVMGRNTYESLPSNFNVGDRVIVVITSSPIAGKFIPTFGSFKEFIDCYEALESFIPIMVIGGIKLLEEALDYADTVYMTSILANEPMRADTFISEDLLSKIYGLFDYPYKLQEFNHPVDNIEYVRMDKFVRSPSEIDYASNT